MNEIEDRVVDTVVQINLIIKYLKDQGYNANTEMDAINIIETNKIDVADMILPRNAKSVSEWKSCAQKHNKKIKEVQAKNVDTSTGHFVVHRFRN